MTLVLGDEIEGGMSMNDKKIPKLKIEEPKPIIGVVNCGHLNMRIGPSIEDDVVGIVSEGCKLIIDMESSNDEFYGVVNEHGARGYCMKKFVTIEK